MNKKDFEDLKAAVAEMVEIERGRRKPASVVKMPANPKKVRENLNLTQAGLAKLIGVKTDTLRNWEYGRRKMPTMARNLMYIAERHPKVILELAR